MGRRAIRSRACHSIFRKRRWRGWRLFPRYAPPSSGRSTPMASFLRVAMASAETKRGGNVRPCDFSTPAGPGEVGDRSLEGLVPLTGIMQGDGEVARTHDGETGNATARAGIQQPARPA